MDENASTLRTSLTLLIGHSGVHLRQHQLALLQHLPAQGRAPQGAAHPPVLIRERAGQRRHPGAPGQEPRGRLTQVGGILRLLLYNLF